MSDKLNESASVFAESIDQKVLDMPESKERFIAVIKLKDHYKEKLKQLNGKTYNDLSGDEKKLVDDAKQFIDKLNSQEAQKELYTSNATELESILKQNILEYGEVKRDSQLKRGGLAVETISENLIQTIDITQTSSETLKKSVELHLYKEEKEAFAAYLGLDVKMIEDMNIYSFISTFLKVSGDTKEDWLNAGYKKDGWIFDDGELAQLNTLKNNSALKNKIRNLSKAVSTGVNIISFINSQKVIEKNGEAKILDSLFDFNADGNVDKNDQSFLKGSELSQFVEKNSQHKEKIIENICKLLGISDTTQTGLYEALVVNPMLKYEFYSKLYFLGMSGVNLSQVLLNGQKGIQSSVEKMGQNLMISEKIVDAMMPGFEGKYNDIIKNLEEKLNDTSLTPEKKQELQALLSLYKENKTSFLDAFRMNGAALAISLLDGKKGAGLGLSMSNSNIDAKVQELSNGIIQGMQLNAGFSFAGGVFTPGIGINFSSKILELSSTTTASFNAGLFLHIPYVTGTLNHNYNQEELKQAGFKDFSKSAESVGITGNLSTLASGVTLHWSKDKLQALEKKEQDFSFLLDDIFKDGFEIENLGLNLLSRTDLSPEDKEYISLFVEKIKSTFDMIGYDNLNTEHKKYALAGLKRGLLNEWKNGLLSAAEKNGVEFSGAGIGLQFVAGFLPILTFGVRGTEIKRSYVADKQANIGQALANPEISSLAKAGKTEKVSTGIEALKNNVVSDYLQKNISKFDGTQNKDQSPIAMRNPRDYGKFLDALKSGNNSKAFDNLLTILKTDSVLKNDKETKSFISQLPNNLNDIQKAYIVSQFMDVIFKDKNSIKQVITTESLWKDREKGLKGVYSSAVYNKVVALRNQVRANVKENTSVFALSSVMGFVASYKIGWKDGNQFSLGKGEAAIPPGLATVVGGESGIKDITGNELLQNQVIENLRKTPFYEKMRASLESVIKNTYNDFTLNDNDFNTILKTGTLNYNGDQINLDRKFVFFLYGQCANETLGLDIKSISIAGKKQDVMIDPTGGISIYRPVGETKHYSVGVAVGEREKEDKPEPQKPTTTPEEEIEPVPPGEPVTPEEPIVPPVEPPTPPVEPPTDVVKPTSLPAETITAVSPGIPVASPGPITPTITSPSGDSGSISVGRP